MRFRPPPSWSPISLNSSFTMFVTNIFFPLTKLVTHTSFGDSRPMKNCGVYRGDILKQRGLKDHWKVDTLPSLALVTVRVRIHWAHDSSQPSPVCKPLFLLSPDYIFLPFSTWPTWWPAYPWRSLIWPGAAQCRVIMSYPNISAGKDYLRPG